MSIKFGQKVMYVAQEDYDPDQYPPVDRAGVVVAVGSGQCQSCADNHTWCVVFFEDDNTPWTIAVEELEVVQ